MNKSSWHKEGWKQAQLVPVKQITQCYNVQVY